MDELQPKKLKDLIVFPLALVLLIWGVECVEQLFEYRWSRYGIYPRDVRSLFGIVTGPFIHSDWKHLISNTFPIFFLSLLMTAFYRRVLVVAYVVIWLLTGFSVWLFARESYHIGISGIVYGLISFIFWSGLFRKDNRSIILSLVILIAYSGYFQGLTPEEGVSWESHLFGAVSGSFVAFFLKNITDPEIEEEKSYDFQSAGEKIKFFPPDTFLKTKEERWIESLMDNEEESHPS